MASAYKHMLRSHRSHHTAVIPVAMFERRAVARAERKNTDERVGLIRAFIRRAIMHRMQNKGGDVG